MGVGYEWNKYHMNFQFFSVKLGEAFVDIIQLFYNSIRIEWISYIKYHSVGKFMEHTNTNVTLLNNRNTIEIIFYSGRQKMSSSKFLGLLLKCYIHACPLN